MKLVESKVKLPYDEMDKEMIEICEFFNTLPGVKTLACCCGHGKEETYIYFKCSKKSTLARILYLFEFSEFTETNFINNWDLEQRLVLCKGCNNIIVDTNGKNKHKKYEISKEEYLKRLNKWEDIGYRLASKYPFGKKQFKDNTKELINLIKEIFKDKNDCLFVKKLK